MKGWNSYKVTPHTRVNDAVSLHCQGWVTWCLWSSLKKSSDIKLIRLTAKHPDTDWSLSTANLRYFFHYMSFLCFTVTEAGSKSGILGTSGSGGLGGAGAGAGLGSSFFLGAITRSSQERRGSSDTTERCSTFRVDLLEKEKLSPYI